LGSTHLSLYQLTIEPDTVFGRRNARGQLPGLAGDDLCADMYQLTQDICDDAGVSAYEISNHAREGQASRHNLIYWRSGDYIGIGPGAHGRLSRGGARFATDTELLPDSWLASVRHGNGEKSRTALTKRDQVTEFIMTGLRLVEGLDLHRLKGAGITLEPRKINYLTELGYVKLTAERLTVTSAGRMVLNAIIRELIPE